MYDLNLLKVFDAMMQTNNVTKTAEMMNKTPSAISQSLSRLRAEYDGEILFIKEGKQMKPTSFALQLHEEIKGPLEVLSKSKRVKEDFDPMTSTRTFNISSNSLIDVLYAAKLISKVKEIAPNVKLKIQGFHFGGDNLQDSLRLRKVDLILNVETFLDRSYASQELLSVKPLIMCRKDHPRLGEKPTEEELLKEGHATWTAGDIVQAAITLPFFVKRDVIYTSDSFFNIFKTVSETDLIALSAFSFYDKIGSKEDLKLLNFPFDLPNIPINMTWHIKSNEDLGITWLRSVIDGIFEEERALLK